MIYRLFDVEPEPCPNFFILRRPSAAHHPPSTIKQGGRSVCWAWPGADGCESVGRTRFGKAHDAGPPTPAADSVGASSVPSKRPRQPAGGLGRAGGREGSCLGGAAAKDRPAGSAVVQVSLAPALILIG